MARGDIDYIIKQLRAIIRKSDEKRRRRDFCLALSELPSSEKVKELKEVIVDLDRMHKIVLRLAAARGPQVSGRRREVKIKNKKKKRLCQEQKSVSSQELQAGWKNVNVARILQEAAEAAAPEIEALRRARALSKAKACCHVLV